VAVRRTTGAISRKLHCLFRAVVVVAFAAVCLNAAILRIGGAEIPRNMLKERILFTSSEFHSGLKHATTSCRKASVAPTAAGLAWAPWSPDRIFEV